MTETPDEKAEAKGLLEWLGLLPVPRWAVARPLGATVCVVLSLFFFGAFVAACIVILRTIGIAPDSGSAASPNLGAGALITAILGAPFLIWATVIKHRALGFQKEGHLTDRISKAVEQLGAEKKVDRIGRPVTIWTGKAERISCPEENAERFLGKARSKAMEREWQQVWNHEKDEVEEGYVISIATWPAERTVVQWMGAEVPLENDEAIGVEGAWQAFPETFPNIEVRVGGILSLERIAQDSMAYDKGRDHVRVMEILCAYVRENARAMNLEPTLPPIKTKVPRIDIQAAMNVIKRRTDEQLKLEGEARYRLDLRQTDLDGCDLSGGKFAGAIFWRSRLEATDLARSDLTGARFERCLLNSTIFREATLRGTNLNLTNCGPYLNSYHSGFFAGKLDAILAIGADLAALDHFEISQFSEIFGTKETTLGDDVQRIREILTQQRKNLERARDDNDAIRIAEMEATIAASPFAAWSELSHQHTETRAALSAFKNAHGLIGWPFDD